MDPEKITGSSPQSGPNGDDKDEDSLITMRAALIISVSAIVGVLVGDAAGVEAGCTVGLAVAAALHYAIRKGS